MIGLPLAAISGCSDSGGASADRRSDKPGRIRLTVPVIETGVASDSLGPLLDRLWPTRGAPLGNALHALRLFDDATRDAFGRARAHGDLLSVLLDYRVNREWFGRDLSMQQTRHGLRYAASATLRAGQPHTDQCLSILAEQGVSLTASIVTPAGSFPVRAVLDDAEANFNLDGELEWTAVAFALYQPPRRVWTDKFGTQYDFDDLASALIRRRFDRASCGGTHALYALAVLRQADARCALLSASMRAIVDEFLGHAVERAAAQQDSTGAIGVFWYAEFVREPWYARLIDSLGGEAQGRGRQAGAIAQWSDLMGEQFTGTAARVQITAHHLEWFFALPAERQPPRATISRAVKFLSEAACGADASELAHAYCAYSHAARILCIFRSFAAPSADELVSAERQTDLVEFGNGGGAADGSRYLGRGEVLVRERTD